ncbi:MAG: septal ring lytic transglycosylase RlpA family protein [Betaproteobacteria bacterium]|nr:septal ring lytic transglycosylase RlpA family protein [Betaproteobacteria bacterium]
MSKCHFAAALALVLAACAAPPPKPAAPAAPALPPPSSKYYSDDGPPLAVPGNLDAIPDAVPRLEPLHRFANRPYTVLGREYVPATSLRPYRERGTASWYGRKFHGQKTSIGEVYDMFAMTAAHPTLPLPSYARVTSAANGRSVIVRVNDRGPFLHGRVIDLSYAAAHRLGIAQRGSGEVEVEAIVPGDVAPGPPLPALAAATPVPEAPVVAEAGGAGGFVVQLGAFANYANAQAFLAHVQNQTASAAVEPRVRQSGGLWRVVVGPYAAREEAAQVAARIAGAFGLAATVRPQ